jgi:argininosuccinate lyase
MAMTEQPAVSLRERLKAPPAPEMVEAYFRPNTAQGLAYQFDHEMDIHLAHGLMLARQDIVPAAAMRPIIGAVLELRERGPGSLAIDDTAEDLYSYFERHLIARLGADIGGRLHTGRSRNDLHTTSWRMALRERVLAVLDGVAAMRRASLALAVAHAETVMPGYTHSQHAQPITLGYYLLTVAALLERDQRRLLAALETTDQCPLGAGALTTTGFPIDRRFTAERLGFAGVLEIAYDGVSCRDDVHETAAALAILATNLSRLAFDLQAWNTAEYGFIELDDGYSAVSSMMPQKKNPNSLEHAKAAAGMVTGALMAVLSCSKNTSLADVSDGVSAVNEPVLDAAGRCRALLPLLTQVMNTMAVRPAAMRRAAEIGFGSATELSDLLVREAGLSFRTAHNIVGHVVRGALAAGKTAIEITAADIDQASVGLLGRTLAIAPARIAEALDPVLNVRARTVLGGPAPDNVRAMARDHAARLDRDVARVAMISGRVAAARDRLHAESRAFAADI